MAVSQLFLSSPKPSLRFAAVRALNRVAMAFPLTVTLCNLDLENMISDSNRSIATLAITTLLKTGSESQVERLMKQISTFMSEIADEFQVDAILTHSTVTHVAPVSHSAKTCCLSDIADDEEFLVKKPHVTKATSCALITYCAERLFVTFCYSP